MRILLDTNILARAAIPGEGPARVVMLSATEDPHVLLMSAFIFSELHRILRYERVRKIHGLDDAGIDRFVSDLQASSATVELPDEPADPVVPSDPDDDPIVATAVAGLADVLCTLDRHLHHADVRSHCEMRGLRILTDIELLAMLREGESASSSRV